MYAFVIVLRPRILEPTACSRGRGAAATGLAAAAAVTDLVTTAPIAGTLLAGKHNPPRLAFMASK